MLGANFLYRNLYCIMIFRKVTLTIDNDRFKYNIFHTFEQDIPYGKLVRYPEAGLMRGMHGYDNTDPDMRAIFLASGPGKSLITYIHL